MVGKIGEYTGELKFINDGETYITVDFPKTIKVIDLLNMIANGKGIPEMIKYNGLIWEYVKEVGDYTDTDRYLFMDFGANVDNYGDFLNDNVEIIEESKKVKPINIDEFLQIRKTKKILYLANKINEIIDFIKENKE